MQKKLWGCEDNAQLPLKLNGEEVWRCPRRPVLEEPDGFRFWLGLYRNYQLGVLPDPGSWLEQASMTVEVFKVLDYAYSRVEEHRASERERKSKSK